MSDIEQAIREFAQGPDKLEAALAGLSASDLDHARDDEGWTIRDIVHHMAEADIRQTTFTRIALLSPGHSLEFSWHPGNKAMSSMLNYARLPIEPSLQLFRANRSHFALMLSAVLTNSPSAWEHYLIVKPSPEEPGTRVTVGEWITGMASHLEAHLAQITNILEEIHGRQADQ